MLPLAPAAQLRALGRLTRKWSMNRELQIEGYTAGELLELPDREIDQLVFVAEPIIIRAGSAEILGSFKKLDDRLVLELAHIDGGGEGVLPALSSLAASFARKRGLRTLEWVVHAVSCAKPNLKLRRVLERRGFKLAQVPGVGDAYHCIQRTDD